MHILDNILLSDCLWWNSRNIYSITWNHWGWHSVIISFVTGPSCSRNFSTCDLIFRYCACPRCCLYIISWRLTTRSMITNCQAHFLGFLDISCAMLQVNRHVLIMTAIKIELSWKWVFWNQFIALGQISIHDWIIFCSCTIWKRSIWISASQHFLIFQRFMSSIINDGVSHFLLISFIGNCNMDIRVSSGNSYCINFWFIWCITINRWRNHFWESTCWRSPYPLLRDFPSN